MTIIDFDGFAKKLTKLQRDHLPRIIQEVILSLGDEMLNEIVSEIQSQDLIRTEMMQESFQKGGYKNIWRWDVDRNAITLEVGSELFYTTFVNDGYKIKKTKDRRGRRIKPRTFMGRKFVDVSLNRFEGGMNALIMQKLEKELSGVL
ncbi:HK97 gp10 family phage protein [Aneurinibacillus thermoaerophilus]|uniref:Bacteriophage HK97-gp10, putative tail-component n=1 Tax=Aneurinibacillus thermoaerophilus TaxID=143495 RepID=A0A1G8ET42_ANETH|nr:HK97 gp10 family phage protein [Aneurinibacillus thermoaerophilus]MED0757408.1 HK97 gp10 family phage protein [Aneurinibacillus thermoaerophilus]MED0762622.1 HK97 gp10 family phage protein [Aneurinibacillus thermoaerophilus]SDH73101.1 Bacteriophage HK97-gp10, putative tail-component [Aneurinibacillus thermoaerophilus]